MSDQFVDTPFNRHCPHRSAYFSRTTEFCPYCGAEARLHAHARLRWYVSLIARWTISAVVVWILARGCR